MPKKKRFKLLLVHDYKRSGVSDNKILEIAFKDKRILVTKNIKHFVKKSSRYKVDVIGLTETMLPEEIDKLLVAKLKRWARLRMSGRFTKIVRAPRRR